MDLEKLSSDLKDAVTFLDEQAALRRELGSLEDSFAGARENFAKVDKELAELVAVKKSLMAEYDEVAAKLIDVKTALAEIRRSIGR